MPKQSFGFEKHIRSFFILGITCIVLLSQFYSCKEEENIAPLEVYSIEPPQAEIGDTIRIIGQGFSPGYAYNHVAFAGGAGAYAQIGSNTGTLLVEVPDGALPGAMTVSILDVETTQTPTIEIIPPVISEIIPAEAWIGDTVVIRGQHFQTNKIRNHVKFGGSDWSTVVSATKTELKAVVPQNAGNGVVSVLGFNGPSFKVKPSVIDAIVPDHAVVGDTILIKGKGMNASNVTFKPAVNATLLINKNDSRNIYTIVPKGAIDGPLTVTCTISSQIIDIESPQPFLVYPSIIEFSPLSGSPGSPVTITGYNFSAVAIENIVSFNGTVAEVTAASTTELVVEVPFGFSNGPVTIAVNGKIVIGPVFSMAENGAPVIYSVAPRSGPIGSKVLINGINFGASSAANTVKFAGNITATILKASTTQLEIEVPEGAKSGQVTVTKEGKTGVGPSFTITASPIPFISSIDPPAAPRNTNITLHGGNFDNSNAGGFAVQTSTGQPLTIISVEPAKIVAQVPAIFSLGDYNILVAQNGKFSNSVPFQLTGTPTITALNINEGLPGVTVTITGTDFDPNETKNIVKFGDTQATLVNPDDRQDDNKVTVYVPEIGAAVYSVTVTAFGNTSVGMNFTVKAKTDPVRDIIYAEYDWHSPGTFRINRRTSNPPTETEIYSAVTAAPFNVLALDPPRSRAFLVDGGGLDISRVNLNGTGYNTIYPGASGGTSLYDLTVDTNHQKIYFTDGWNGGVIYSGNMNGPTADFLVDLSAIGNVVPLSLSYVPENDLLYICGPVVDGTDMAVLQMPTDGSSYENLFTQLEDGLINPLDAKIDVNAQKIFILDNQNIIKFGKLDGSGSLTILTTRSQPILGMAIDVTAPYVYWLEVSATDATKASVFRKKYDSPSTEEEVYTNILVTDDNVQSIGVGGLALDGDNGSGSSQRGAFSFSGLKIRKKIDKNVPLLLRQKTMKKARPGK